jgi:hypothetical protein
MPDLIPTRCSAPYLTALGGCVFTILFREKVMRVINAAEALASAVFVVHAISMRPETLPDARPRASPAELHD